MVDHTGWGDELCRLGDVGLAASWLLPWASVLRSLLSLSPLSFFFFFFPFWLKTVEPLKAFDKLM